MNSEPKTRTLRHRDVESHCYYFRNRARRCGWRNRLPRAFCRAECSDNTFRERRSRAPGYFPSSRRNGSSHCWGCHSLYGCIEEAEAVRGRRLNFHRCLTLFSARATLVCQRSWLQNSLLSLLVKSKGAVAQLGERMTGSHEVRGSIPLGSTNSINNLGHPSRMPFLVLCAYSVPTLKRLLFVLAPSGSRRR